MPIINAFPEGSGSGGGVITGFPPFMLSRTNVQSSYSASQDTSSSNRFTYFYNDNSSLKGYGKYIVDLGGNISIYKANPNVSSYNAKFEKCLIKPFKALKIYWNEVEKADLTPDKLYRFGITYQKPDSSSLTFQLKLYDSNSNEICTLNEASGTGTNINMTTWLNIEII